MFLFFIAETPISESLMNKQKSPYSVKWGKYT